MLGGTRTAAPAEETYSTSIRPGQARERVLSDSWDIAARCMETLRETHETPWRHILI